MNGEREFLGVRGRREGGREGGREGSIQREYYSRVLETFDGESREDSFHISTESWQLTQQFEIEREELEKGYPLMSASLLYSLGRS